MNEIINSEYLVKGKRISELEDILTRLGENRYRAIQIFQGLYKHRYSDWDSFSNLPKSLRVKLAEKAPLEFMPITSHQVSVDGTQKFAFSVGEGKEMEAVWIPRGDGERKTICISSQVGCTLNCKFCATGTLKFQGNLKTWQILDQVLTVEAKVGDRATNIVFMGMGEPFHNYQEVIRAAEILHDPEGFNLGGRRITISTAGVVPNINRFIDESQPFNLAISLNQADPSLRSDVMDVNKKYDLESLIQSAQRYVQVLKRPITFEYVMIPGVTMGKTQIEHMAKIAKKVDQCKFNVIPLNTNFHGWQRPTDSEIESFVSELKKRVRVPVLNRRSPGKEIDGACGMLALRTEKSQESLSLLR